MSPADLQIVTTRRRQALLRVLEARPVAREHWQVVPGYASIAGSGQTVLYAPSRGEPTLCRARVWLETR